MIPPARIARDRICKRLRSPGIDSEESILPGWDRFLGSSKDLQRRALAGWYDNTIPTRFLAPIDCSKNLAQVRYRAPPQELAFYNEAISECYSPP